MGDYKDVMCPMERLCDCLIFYLVKAVDIWVCSAFDNISFVMFYTKAKVGYMTNSAEKLGERGVLADSMHLAGPTVNT